MNISENPNTLWPQIPGYSISSIIGQGGFSTVYLAQQHNLQREVALKVMSPLLTPDPNICARFLREARDTASLSNHPNIITVHDVGQTGHIYYIAMQFMSGPSLRQLIDKASLPGKPEALIYQLASVLNFIHQRGVVHRDIKPANILFDDAGHLVLSDFGVASLTTHTLQLTQDGSITGTARYMSPEQCQGNSDIDARSDLYSLGIVFFEMLTGFAPFEAIEPMALMLKHLNEPIPRLPEQHRQYQPLIDKLLAKQADQRYASAAIVMQILEQLPASNHSDYDAVSSGASEAKTYLAAHEIHSSTVVSVGIALSVVLSGSLVFLNMQADALTTGADVDCPALSEASIQARNDLLELASVHEQIGRLTHPPGANALEAYSLALDIDPCNTSILNTVEKIRHE